MACTEEETSWIHHDIQQCMFGGVLGVASSLVYNLRAVHYGDVIMGTIASQITSLTIVYLTVYSDADQRKYQSSASLAFVRGIHRGPVNSPRKWPVTRKMFPFDDVIMFSPAHSNPWLSYSLTLSLFIYAYIYIYILLRRSSPLHVLIEQISHNNLGSRNTKEAFSVKFHSKTKTKKT